MAFTGGSEIIVNGTLAGNQQFSSVQVLADGKIVLSWTDYDPSNGDGDLSCVKARILNADGTPFGSEFLVNIASQGFQGGSSIAALAGGGFVIVWTNPTFDQNGTLTTEVIYSRVYSSTGVALTGETLVNPTYMHDGFPTQVYGLAGGGFAVAYSATLLPSDTLSAADAFVQLFDANGTSQGSAIALHSPTPEREFNPRLVPLSNGGFAAVWSNMADGAVPAGAHVQTYSASGAATGTEIFLNGGTSSIAALSDGNFVVVTYYYDLIGGNLEGIRGQILDASLNSIGAAFEIGEAVLGNQGNERPSVVALANGQFVVTYLDDTGLDTDQSFNAVRARLFNNDGTAVGASVQINTQTVGDQERATITANPAGGFIITYTDYHADYTFNDLTATGDVKIRIFGTGGFDAPIITSLGGGSVGDVYVEGGSNFVVDASARDPNLGDSQTWSISGGADAGLFTINAATGVLSLIDPAAHDPYGVNDLQVQVTVADGSGNEDSQLVNVHITPPSGFDIYAGGADTFVNQTITGNQQFSSISHLANGGYVVTWTDYDNSEGEGDGDGSCVKARVYDASGTPTTGEFIVNTVIAGTQSASSVLGLSSGGFIVAWNSYDGTTGQLQIRIQLFNEFGDPVMSGEQAINGSEGAYTRPNLTELSDGSILLSWSGPGNGSTGTTEAFAAKLTFDTGSFVYSTVTLNPGPADYQSEPSISALDGGGFVAVWASSQQDSGLATSYILYARKFDNDGNPTGPQFQIDTENLIAPAGEIYMRAIVHGLPGGGFVATWHADGATGDGSGSSIRGVVYDAAGTVVRSFQANSSTPGDQINPMLDVLADGSFIITWTDRGGSGGDGSNAAIKGQFFNADGTRSGAEFLVNGYTNGDQAFSAITALAGGGFAVSYTDYNAPLDPAGNNAGDVLVRVFSPAAGISAPEIVSLGGGDFATVDVVSGTNFVVDSESRDLDIGDGAIWAIENDNAEVFTIDPVTGVLSFINPQTYDPFGFNDYEVTIRVTDSAGNVDVQTITVNVVPAPDLVPGDTSSTVHPTAGGTTLVTLESLNDHDWYRVDLVAGTTYTFTTSGNGGVSDTTLAVRDSNGTQLNFNDNANDGSYSEIIFTPTTSGTYYIDAAAAGGSEVGTFLLTMTPEEGGGGANDFITVTEDDIFSTQIIDVLANDGAGATLASLVGSRVTSNSPRLQGDNALQTYMFSANIVDGKIEFELSGYSEWNKLAPGETATIEIDYQTGAGAIHTLTVTVTGTDDLPSLQYRTIDDAENNVLAAQFNVVDPDSPLPTFTYSIAGGADASKFTIDPVTGALRFITAPDFENPTDADGDNGYLVSIHATDGNGHDYDLVDNNIVVRNANENPAFVLTGTERTLASSGNTGGDSIYVAQFTHPVVTSLADGRSVVAYTRGEGLDEFGSPVGNIYFQFLDESGVPIGAEFSAPSGGDSRAPSITTLSNGNFAIAWLEDIPTESGNYLIRAQIFAPSGSPLGTSVSIETLPWVTGETNFQFAPSIVANQSGGFILGWDMDSQDGVAGTESRLQIFDSSGVATAPSFTLDSPGGYREDHPRSATLADGSFVAVWSQVIVTNGNANGGKVWSQHFSATGTALSAPSLIDAAVDVYNSRPEVTALPDGGYVVVWTGGAFPSQALLLQRFDANGTSTGGAITVSDALVGATANGATVLPDGNLLVTWQSQGGTGLDGYGSGIAGRIFDSSLNPAGDSFPINVSQYAYQDDADVTVNAAGKLIAVWSTTFGQLPFTAAAGNDVRSATYTLAAPTNHAPVANNGTAAGDEDGTLTGTVAATDADGDALTYSVVTNPAHGTLTLNSTTGAYSYAPDANYNGSDSFTFKANDGTANSNIATVSLSVAAVNDRAMILAPATFAATEQTALILSNGSIQFTDIDAGEGIIAATLQFNEGSLTIDVGTTGVTVAPPVTPNGIYRLSGTLAQLNSLLAGGGGASVTYLNSSDAPPPSVQFAIGINDQGNTGSGGDTGDYQIRTINISAVNDAPTVSNPFVDIVMPEETMMPLVNFASAFSDVDAGDTLTYTATLTDGSPLPGWIVLVPNGIHMFGIPPQEYAGTVSIRITATDGQGASVSDDFTITVTPVNDRPVAFGSTTTLLEDGSVGVGLQANDVDSPNLTFTIINGPSNGSLTVNPNGSYTYTPNANFNGTDSFDFRANDGFLDSNVATVSLSVTAVNDAPTQVADQGNVTINEGQSLSLSFAGNFSDVDGDTLTYSATGLPSWLTINTSTGVLSGAAGSTDAGVYSIVVSASDGSLSASDSFTLTVNDVNVAPIVSAPVTLAAIAEDSPAITITSAQLLANASDADGDTLSVTGLTASSGTLVSNGNGTWSYTPAANDNSSVTFSYFVSDGPHSVATLATLDLTPVNDAPTIVTDLGVLNTNEDALFSIDLSNNFADIDGDALTLTINNKPAWLIYNPTTHILSGTPANGDVGSYNLSITASDGQVTITDGFTLNVINTNDAPIVTGAVTLPPIAEDSSAITITAAQLLSASSDPDVGDVLAVVNLAASSGTLVSSGPGTWSFTPDSNFNGNVTLSYGVTDGNIATPVVTTATLNVTPVNDAPILSAPLVDQTSPEDAAFSFALPANSFTDVDGDTLTLTATFPGGAPLPGWISFDAATRTFTGTPPLNFNAQIDVRVTATDASGESASDVFTLDIIPVNDAPVAGPITLPAVLEDGTTLFSNGQLLSGATDVDGDTLTVTGVTASSGTLTASSPSSWTFSPALNATAPVTLSVTISDGTTSILRLVTLPIAPVNDAPTLASPLANVAVAEDAAFSFTIPANTFADVDGDTLILSATLPSGLPLPSWISFNAATRTFSGTPPLNFDGQIDIRVTATDNADPFAALSVASTFTLDITPVNDAPVLAAPIPDANAAEDAAFSFTLPAGTFTDIDSGALTFTTSALPSWLSFNATTRTFSGTPTNANVGTFNVTVTASDGSLSASDVFAITVTNTNDAPTVAVAIVDQAATQGTAFSFALPAGTFADVDVGDTLTLSAAGVPAWLAFNPTTRTFTGTPGAGDVGAVNISVTATDSAGATVTDIFAITVAPSGPPPITGSEGVDFLFGTRGNDVINALGGIDIVLGNGGDDIIDGGAGNDFLDGGIGNDTLLGGSGNDRMFGGSGNDLLSGGTGDDRMFGDDGNDSLSGDDGDDTLDGGSGNDSLSGGNGADDIDGGSGTDTLRGGAGNDQLNGGSGADRLEGGAGSDRLEGGNGADVFVFSSVSDSAVGASRDRILDFTRGSDVIDLSAIDANTNLAGNQAFSFIGSAAFSGVAGQLRFAGGIVSGDVNGDGIADFEIQVQFNGGPPPPLVPGDFIP